MQREVEIKAPSLSSGSELVVLAPVRRGFVPAMESVTYATRARLLLAALHGGRRGLHEERILRVMSDAVERVGVIHSVRVAVLDADADRPERILLSVNFDGSFEAYVRVIWQKASRLLDLIFCNTEGYVPGWESSFADWSRWLRSVQVEARFFYATPGVARQDQTYFRMLDRLDRSSANSELPRSQLRIASAEQMAWSLSDERMRVDLSDPTASNVSEPPYANTHGIRQGLQALAGIYRLADLYPHRTSDGLILLRAARELLPELCELLATNGPGQVIRSVAHPRLTAAVDWLATAHDELPAARRAVPRQEKVPDEILEDVQRGILKSVDGTTDGCLCLVSLEGPAGADSLLRALAPTPESDSNAELIVTLGFTADGLRACGLNDDELEQFPLEFRQGMAARAGLLGDVRGNHPRRWALPRRNWPAALSSPWDEPTAAEFSLDAVHAIIQLRWCGQSPDAANPDATRQLLARSLRDKMDPLQGVRPLSVQWMRRMKHNGKVVEHFGYTDGQSQPEFASATSSDYDNHVHLGEALVGHPNAADDSLPEAALPAVLRNGSFWVVRKLAQNVELLNKAVADVVKQESQRSNVDAATVRAKLMGRWPAKDGDDSKAGQPMLPTPSDRINDFTYARDPNGDRCPLGAHIRRANPRETAPLDGPPPIPGARPARLVRRSLPFGPSYTKEPAAERGLMFMAFNASLAEQFEVIQQWLSGGNSAGNPSTHGCPFVGVPESGRQRYFRFVHNNHTVRVALDGGGTLGPEPHALVRLLWGAYLFAPSISATHELQQRAKSAQQVAQPTTVPWRALDGAIHIARLRELERQSGGETAALAWKAALEDPEALRLHVNSAIWASVREHHGGVLRIPYGVLVARREDVDSVLLNRQGNYTVVGYQERLAPGLGEIFLGLDAGDNYQQQSEACNKAIQENLTRESGFTAARKAAHAALEEFIKKAQAVYSTDPGEPRWELNLDVRDLIDRVLASLCEQWFGLENDPELFVPGGFDGAWEGGPVRYPGHFTAQSRYTFQPLPGPGVRRLGLQHGRALREAMTEFLRARQEKLTAPITRAVLDSRLDIDLAARTVAGAMMGFLPSTDGGLRKVFIEWTREGTLATLRARNGGAPLDTWPAASKLLEDSLKRTMQLRPVPEQIWRRVVNAHSIGTGAHAVALHPGDTIVLGLVSATQQGLEEGAAPDVVPVFGGLRKSGGPTHACPGYHAALGVMVGVLAAVLECKEAMRPGPVPGVLSFEGPLPRPTDSSADGKWYARHAFIAETAERAGKLGPLLAYGDSWFCYSTVGSGRSDLGVALADLGWDTRSFYDAGRTKPGWTLAEMADQRRLKGFADHVRAVVRDSLADPVRYPLPAAILIGGGGNDFAGSAHPLIACGVPSASRLIGVLRNSGSNPEIDEAKLTDFLNEMKAYLRRILDTVGQAASIEGKGQLIPVLVHAYDRPVPDGRSSHQWLCSVLRPCFAERRFAEGDPNATRIMGELIDRLGQAYGEVVRELVSGGTSVTFANLGGTLQSNMTDWSNELHPSPAGFKKLAEALRENHFMRTTANAVRAST
jgi:deferrochelatase/peroxidase EfeB